MRRFIVAAAAAALFLSACASEGDAPPETPPSTPGESLGESAAVPGTPGVDLPTVEDEELAEGLEMPVFTFPDADAPEELTIGILREGAGREVQAGDMMVADYVGTVWGSDEPFDSSFFRGQPAIFDINRLVAGWRDGVVGTHVGDRLVLAIPSELGYAEGNPNAGIEVGDVIVFVIDIFDSRPAGEFIGESGTATGDLPDGVMLTGEPGSPAIPVIDSAATEPTEPEVVVVHEGSGAPIETGEFVVAGFGASLWDNQPFGSNWDMTWDGAADPYGVQAPIGVRLGGGSAFDELTGLPVGSRALIMLPADSAQGLPAQAILVDIVSAQE